MTTSNASLHDAASTGVELPTRTSPEGARSRCLSDILADPSSMTPPAMLLRGLLHRRHITLLAAREKLGKSTLAAFMCAVLTRGWDFLGETAPVSRVLWVSLEEIVFDVADRLQRMGVDPSNAFVLHDLSVKERKKVLLREVERVRPQVVIIDTLASWAEGVGDENSAHVWAPVFGYFRRMSERFDCAILLLHHGSKSMPNAYRGSTAIGAGVDNIVTMEGSGDRLRPNLRLLSGKGRTGSSEVRLEYDVDNARFVIVEDVESARSDEAVQRDVREKLRTWIEMHGPSNKTTVTKAIGVRAEVAREVFDEMVSLGELVRMDDGRFELPVNNSADLGCSDATPASGRLRVLP